MTKQQPLPAIKGVPYPRWHQKWCDPASHRANWSDIIEYGYDLDAPPCHLHLASGFLPEVRRCADPAVPPTRARQDSWGVGLEQAHLVSGDGHEYVDDAVVVLGKGAPDDDVFRLLPGEARELAAALIRAADMMTFS